MIWILFGAVVALLFSIDLFTQRGAFARVATYVMAACAFGAWIWLTAGADSGMKFFTAYALEMSLSLDNVFVMSLIFGALAIPPAYRERVLIYGILSAMVLRALFIGFGIGLANAFEWALILCGAFLIYVGIKGLFAKDGDEEMDLDKNRVYKFLTKIMPVTGSVYDNRLFCRRGPYRMLHATPLFVALVLVEIADVVFAADSVPATLAVTTDPLLVYTSNIFAILCLRALYSVLEKMTQAFEYLAPAVSAVLIFIGVKIVADKLLGFHIENWISLTFVLTTLSGGVLFSLLHGKAIEDEQS